MALKFIFANKLKWKVQTQATSLVIQRHCNRFRKKCSYYIKWKAKVLITIKFNKNI